MRIHLSSIKLNILRSYQKYLRQNKFAVQKFMLNYCGKYKFKISFSF